MVSLLAMTSQLMIRSPVLYALTVVGGPLVGPVRYFSSTRLVIDVSYSSMKIIGSAVSNHPSLGWRWCEYLVVILSGTIVSGYIREFRLDSYTHRARDRSL